MPREVCWERMFPDELEAAIAACPVAWLPYGLCEPHGPINAVGMDAIRAHACCRMAAHEFGGVVAPPFYWHCHELGGYGAWAVGRIGNARPWLSAMPPWMFFKNVLYHLRAVDALGFKAAVIFSGHSGPHRLDFPVFRDAVQPHLAVRFDYFLSLGTDEGFGDSEGTGGHAGRGETSVLWAVAPDCVDLSRYPGPEVPGPHFAMGDLNLKSDRRAGERLARDAASRFIARAKQLIAEYDDAGATSHSPLTFEQTEAIWDSEIRPRLGDFASMQTSGQEPPEGSIWRANWRVPQRG